MEGYVCLTKSTPKNEYKQKIKMVRYNIACLYIELAHKALNTYNACLSSVSFVFILQYRVAFCMPSYRFRDIYEKRVCVVR